MILKKYIEPSEWNPRSEDEDEELEFLEKSINAFGLIGPVIVRPNQLKEGYFKATAGNRRLKTFKDDEMVPCIIRDEPELDAKITCLMENYARTNLSNIDFEKFIVNIYQDGINQQRWTNISEMAEKTKIKQERISRCLIAQNDRVSLGLDGHLSEKLSTTDLNETRPLKDKPELRKKVLEQRAKRKIKGAGHELQKMSQALLFAPENVQKAILKHDEKHIETDPPETPEKNTNEISDEDHLKGFEKLVTVYREIRSMKPDQIHDKEVMRQVVKCIEEIEKWNQIYLRMFSCLLY